MEVTTRASTAFLTAVFLIVAAAFPAALAHDSPYEVSGPAHAPSAAPSPTGGLNSLSSDGTAIDQGIAYVLMLVALILTYLIH